MSIATSPIEFKGFMLGYLHKAAMAAPEPGDPDSDDPAGAFAPAGDYNPTKLSPGEQERQADLQEQGEPAAERQDTPSPYGALGGQLADLWPGAAIGAAGVGGASMGIDAMRKKPLNVKRAILLSLLLGIPLGAAGQMGVMGGTDAYKQFGGNVAGASRQALKDILSGATKAKDVAARKIKGGINA